MALLLIGLITVGIVFFAAFNLFKGDKLPVLGEAGHKAGSFSFLNQHGEKITEKEVEGKVAIAEYFFTRCAGICPIMNKNLAKIHETFKDRSDFVILSHSVDPERDSVTAMRNYAARFNATPPSWQFLTGDKYSLYKAAREDYLLAVEDTVTTTLEEDFIHTEFVTLLDKQRRIRGFYNATDSLSVEKLKKDLTTLFKE